MPQIVNKWLKANLLVRPNLAIGIGTLSDYLRRKLKYLSQRLKFIPRYVNRHLSHANKKVKKEIVNTQNMFSFQSRPIVDTLL